VLDIYAALPSITGKIELEYEGELKGGETVARELIRLSTGKVFTTYFDGENLQQGRAVLRTRGHAEDGRDRRVGRTCLKELTRVQGLLEKTGSSVWV
jgi:magnesium chelatase subunit I